MSEERFSTARLLALRKLTRAVADLLRGRAKEYLTTLSPLLRPRDVLGAFVDRNWKETAPSAERAFRELQSLYESVVTSKPFNRPKELKTPLDLMTSALEITPVEYSHAARTERESKNVLMMSPFRWALTYQGFSPARFKDVLRNRTLTGDEVEQFVIHYLTLHVVLSKNPGVAAVLEALRFPLSAGRLPEFGELPVTFLTAPVSTARPPDEVIIESTELSGRDVFEEVVNVPDITEMSDPLRTRLLELVKQSGEGLG